MSSETLNVIQAITVVIIPFVTIFVAQSLVSTEAKRREVRDLLVKINRDFESFYIAVMQAHPQTRRPAVSFGAQWIVIEDLQKAKDDAATDLRLLLEARTFLNNDCASLDLLCDKDGHPIVLILKAAIRETETMLMRQETASVETVSKYFDNAFVTLAHEIRTLWSRTKGDGWVSSNE